MSKFGELIDLKVPVLLDFYAEWNDQSTAMHAVLRDVPERHADRQDAHAHRRDGQRDDPQLVSPLPSGFRNTTRTLLLSQSR